MEPFTLLPDFMTHLMDARMIERRLWAELDFVRHEGRPRYEYWQNDFDLPYTYGKGAGQRTYPAQPWHPVIHEIRTLIWVKYGDTMDSCFVNGYKDGHDHLGWHADDSPEMDDARPIYVISVGAEREIWVRPKGDAKAPVTKILLPNGSAFRMDAGMQDTHEHRIPKSPLNRCPPRLSLTYRGLVR